MSNPTYDLIGDIHGHHGKLVTLLRALGYRPRDGEGFASWAHPAGRRVIFLGDYIDRGPAAREVLRTVRGMVEAGDALAIMGNHEYNAVCWHAPDGAGGWLRERRDDRDAGLRVTLRQFRGREAEWAEWLEWMRRLPFFLEVNGLRAVHACWDARRIERLRDANLADDDFLRRSAEKRTPEHRAIENVVKGPELALPDGKTFPDKEGIPRRALRVRWWDLPEGAAPVGPLALPEPMPIEEIVPHHELRRVPDYAADEPPVFVGHYWLPPERPRAPLAPNVACLDYAAALAEHPLVAYRWDGERELSAEKFFAAEVVAL